MLGVGSICGHGDELRMIGFVLSHGNPGALAPTPVIFSRALIQLPLFGPILIPSRRFSLGSTPSHVKE